ncbi:MAG: hypothetical protein AAFS10_03260 [Myxococcota bacterium]
MSKHTFILSLFVVISIVLSASVALAGLPVCGSSTPRGTVCAMGTTVKTACGNGKFLNGAVRNAGNLEDGCFALSNNSAGPNTTKAKKAKSQDVRRVQ